MKSEAFSQYTKELSLSKYEPLKTEEERKLLLEFANGSVVAFNKLVNAHLRYVVFFLRNYTIPNNVDIMDVIQEANMGMMEGIRRYDATRYTCRVFSFCFFYVRLSISRFLKGLQKEKSLFRNVIEGDEAVAGEDFFSTSNALAAKDIIQSTLTILEDKERKIIVLLFGLQSPYQPKSLQEVGSILQLSAERIRQIKDEALVKLEKKEALKHL